MPTFDPNYIIICNAGKGHNKLLDFSTTIPSPIVTTELAGWPFPFTFCVGGEEVSWL